MCLCVSVLLYLSEHKNNKNLHFWHVTLAVLRPLNLSISYLSFVREAQLRRGGGRRLSTRKEGLCFARESWEWKVRACTDVIPSGRFVTANWKHTGSFDTDLSTGRMWLECWTHVSAVGETSFPFQFKDRLTIVITLCFVSTRRSKRLGMSSYSSGFFSTTFSWYSPR